MERADLDALTQRLDANRSEHGQFYTGEFDVIVRGLIAEIRDLRQALTGRTVSCSACNAAAKRIEVLEENDAVARDLLKRVVIRHGAGEWTEEQMRDWCCEYKDFMQGAPAAWIRKPHDKCRHRERSGLATDENGGLGA